MNDVILSKTFDNGMICASEQAVIVDEEVHKEVKAEMIANGCYFVTKEEQKLLEKLVIREDTCAVNPDIVGKSPEDIANLAGFYSAREKRKILVAEILGAGAKYPLSREKN
ncbi:hypothetical protein GCM10020331_073010 [Ectobacillus funiculus]